MGIKHCKYVDSEIMNQSHSEVDFDSQNLKNSEQAKTKKSKTYAHMYQKTVQYDYNNMAF